MKNVRAVMVKREMAAYFSSPIAYIVTCLFLVVSGFTLFAIFFINNRADLRQFFGTLPLLFALFIPALTMRLFSEEKRTGSIETLLTLPVTSNDVVAGKFISSLLFSFFMLLPTLAYVITTCVFGSPDIGPLVGGYLGALLLAASFSSIGLFASAMTKNQIVAFFVSLAICIVLSMIDQVLIFLPATVVNFLEFISAGSHFTSISRGILDTRDIIYFLSVTALFYGLTIRVVNSRSAA